MVAPGFPWLGKLTVFAASIWVKLNIFVVLKKKNPI